MNFIVGGIKGLAQTISIKKKEPTLQLRERFNVPDHDICVHDFNCALQDKILLQGNLYIYNTMVCFHSQFNNRSIVGSSDTLIAIPYSQVIIVEKKKKLLFDNSINLVTVNGSYFFTSFVSRDKAHTILNEYLEMFRRLLPNPYQQVQNNDHQFDQIDNEDEWLKHAIISIQQMEEKEQRDQLQIQDQGQRQQQNQNDNQIRQQQQQQQIPPQQPEMVQSRIRNSAVQNINGEQQQQLKIKQEEEQNNNNLIYTQRIQQQLEQQGNNQNNNYNNNQIYINQASRAENIKEEEQKQNSQINQHNYNQYQNQQIEIEEEIQPLELQKSVIKEFEDHAAIYQPLFDERGNKIRQKINKDFTSATFSEVMIKNISAREFFGLFFSNQKYFCERLNKQFNSFLEYYVLEYLHGTNVSISEIQIPPPEIYNSIYSNNYLQLLEYPEYSERHMSFTHPIPNASAFLPKSLQCQIKEHIYWLSPKSFTIVRYLALKGAPLTGNIEPRVIYQVEELDGNILMQSGFYVHFKSSSMFKKIIEKSSKEENEKTWNELKNLLCNVSESYIKKRDSNKLMVQEENQQFLKQYNPNEYEQYDEEDFNENTEAQSIQKNNQQQQVPKLLPQQQEQYERELSHVAAKASNQACTIF